MQEVGHWQGVRIWDRLFGTGPLVPIGPILCDSRAKALSGECRRARSRARDITGRIAALGGACFNLPSNHCGNRVRNCRYSVDYLLTSDFAGSLWPSIDEGCLIFIVERLMRFLTSLNQDVEIVIRNIPGSRRPGRVYVTAD